MTILSKTGIIYRLIDPDGKVYVGQTVQKIEDRWYQHEYYAKFKKKYGCRLLTESIIQHGFNKFKKEILLYRCDIKYLNMYESVFIKFYDSLSPNGLNLTKGGNRQTIYSDHSREYMSKSQRKNSSKYHEYTKDLPAHIFIKVRKGKICGYGVRDKQTNLHRTFANSKYSIDQNKMYAICYLNTGKYDDITYDKFIKSYIPCPIREKIHEPELIKKQRKLPKNIYLSEKKGTDKKGYEVRIKSNKKISLRKQFLSRFLTMDEKLQHAIDFLNLYKNNIKKDCSSQTKCQSVSI